MYLSTFIGGASVYRYSLDGVVIDLRVRSEWVRQKMSELDSIWGYQRGVQEVKSWIGVHMSMFAENYNVKFIDGTGFYVGLRANWKPSQSEKQTCTMRIDFNPAKVGNNPLFWWFHGSVIKYGQSIVPKRFDVAIDLEYPREDVFIRKDHRAYKLFQYSESDKTEYLGSRSSHGYVKLYNKQREAKLKSPLTRLEITVDYERSRFIEFQAIFPEVYIVDTRQIDIGGEMLNETEKVLVLACSENPSYVRMLGRKMATKIKTALAERFLSVSANEVEYNKILSQLYECCKCHLDEKVIIGLEDMSVIVGKFGKKLIDFQSPLC